VKAEAFRGYFESIFQCSLTLLYSGALQKNEMIGGALPSYLVLDLWVPATTRDKIIKDPMTADAVASCNLPLSSSTTSFSYGTASAMPLSYLKEVRTSSVKPYSAQ
jgi:hypothetical protein